MSGWLTIFLLLLSFYVSYGISLPDHISNERSSHGKFKENYSNRTWFLPCPVKKFAENTRNTALWNLSYALTEYCIISLKRNGQYEYSYGNLSTTTRIEIPVCDHSGTQNTDVIRLVYNGYMFTELLRDKSADNLIAFVYFHLDEDSCRKYINQQVINDIKASTIVQHSHFITHGKNNWNCVNYKILLPELNYTNIGKCKALWDIKLDICKKMESKGMFETGYCGTLPAFDENEGETNSTIGATFSSGEKNLTKKEEQRYCAIKFWRDSDTISNKTITDPNELCVLSLKIDGEVAYGIDNVTSVPSGEMPFCAHTYHDESTTDRLRVVYKGNKFSKVIQNAQLAKHNLIGFMYFYYDDDVCRQYRTQEMIDKIKANSIVKHFELAENDRNNTNCVDGNGTLRKEINYQNIGKCKPLWTIKMLTCYNLYTARVLQTPESCYKLPSFDDERGEIPPPTPKTTTQEPTTVAITTTTEVPTTTTTTHNPYVGNYRSKEQEAKYVKMIKDREAKSTKSVKEPKRQQEVEPQLILTILLLTFMGAFSVFVILYNGLMTENEPPTSCEDTSEEEEDWNDE